MISVQDLSYTYPSATEATLRNLSFQVQEGEIFGFLGPSGAGKSTTQNVLIGILHGWSGDVQVLGRSVHTWGADYYRTIGVSFELPNHYLKLTARENLEYFRSLHGERSQPVESVLEQVGLLEHADKKVSEFSKGMKNRLNFCRSLLHQPRLWFLDEPTSGLDPVNAVRVRELIRSKQREGVTVLLTTHDMHTAESVCDRVAFIVDGQIAAIDSPDALRQRYGRKDVQVEWQEGEQLQSKDFPLKGLNNNPEFLQAIAKPGLRAIHSQEATLEHVFVKVTGRALQ